MNTERPYSWSVAIDHPVVDLSGYLKVAAAPRKPGRPLDEARIRIEFNADLLSRSGMNPTISEILVGLVQAGVLNANCAVVGTWHAVAGRLLTISVDSNGKRCTLDS